MSAPLLRRPVFRRYWSAQSVSFVGDQITEIAVPLLAVLAIGAGPAEMGVLTAAALLPNLFFSLPAGAWVDRFPHKRHVMIAADLGRAALLLVVPLLWWADVLTLPLLVGMAFGVGTLTVAFEVAHASLFAAVVPRADYVAANGLINGSRAFSYVAGPSLGGLLVQVLTAPFALVADAVSYLGSAFFLARVRVDPAGAADGDERGMRAGVRFVVRSPVLRAILFGAATLNLFNYIFAALFVLYVTTSLGVAPGVLGVIIGAGAVGGLLGAALAGPLTRRIGVGRAVIVGFVLFPAPLLLVPAAGGGGWVLVMLFASEFLSAAGVMVLDIAAGSVQTAATPPRMLAVASGFKRTVNYGVRPLGALLGGVLGTAIGVRPALWIAAVGGLLGVIWVWYSPLRTMRDLPAECGEAHVL